MASNASGTSNSSALPKNKKAGVLSETSMRTRTAAIVAIQEVWGVERVEDVFPPNIRPKFIGNSTIGHMRSISGRLSNLSDAQALFLGECKDEGRPIPATFSHVLNVWNALKKRDATSDSTPNTNPKHNSKESSGRVSTGKGSDKIIKKASIKSSTIVTSGPKLVVPNPAIAPPLSVSGTAGNFSHKQQSKKDDVSAKGHSTDKGSDKFLYNDKNANFKSNDLFSRSLVSDHKKNPGPELGVLAKKALTDPFLFLSSKNLSSSSGTSLSKELDQNPHSDMTRKRSFVADRLDQALDPISKKLKEVEKMKPIGNDDAPYPAKLTSSMPAEIPKKKTPAEKTLPDLLFSTDDEDEAQGSPALQIKGLPSPEDEVDAFSKHMAEQLAKARSYNFNDTPRRASEPPTASELPKALELLKAPQLPKTPEPQADEANGPGLDLDVDTITVDVGELADGQSVTAPRNTLVTSPPAKGRRTSPFQKNRRTSNALKSDLNNYLPSKVVCRALGAKNDHRAPVAPMVHTSNEENPLKGFVSQLPSKVGELLDLQKILDLAGPEQTSTYLGLKSVFETTIRHLEQDIAFVFQKEQEHRDDY